MVRLLKIKYLHVLQKFELVTSQKCDSSYHNSSVIRQVFLCKSHRNLDQSYKMVLEFWDCFRG